MITIMKAILSINPNAKCSIDGEDLSTIEWLDGTTPIATADIQAKYDEMVEKENNLPNVKASAKAKLVAGEPLTEAEADTLVI
tara:strand:- start:160 stop:408 length:249 start_codon:yes stop_codon:yes gene_type:complete